MIIDTKAPPPAYSSSNASRTANTLSTLPSHILLHVIYLTFPQHSLPDLPKLARQRKTLYWLSVSLRLVDRSLYAACMHVLRSTHIPAYDVLVRAPYTSDPFPLLAPQVQTINPSPYAPIPPSNFQPASPLSTIQRETAVLDKFIALKVREDVWADDSELHLERDEAYKDLFDHAQPRARLEDLVRMYGVQRGVISVGSLGDPGENRMVLSEASAPQQEPDAESKPRLFPPGPSYFTPTPLHPPSPSSHSPTTSTSTFPTAQKSLSIPKSFFSFFQKSKSQSQSQPLPSPASPSSSPLSTQPDTQPPPSHPKIQTKTTPLPMSNLTITLTPRNASLVLADSTSRRTIVSTPRARDEDLESVARRLVDQLREA